MPRCVATHSRHPARTYLSVAKPPSGPHAAHQGPHCRSTYCVQKKGAGRLGMAGGSGLRAMSATPGLRPRVPPRPRHHFSQRRVLVVVPARVVVTRASQLPAVVLHPAGIRDTRALESTLQHRVGSAVAKARVAIHLSPASSLTATFRPPRGIAQGGRTTCAWRANPILAARGSLGSRRFARTVLAIEAL